MISISYKVRRRYSTSESEQLALASETDLRYRLFLGDVAVRVGDVTFDASWGWVPVLDFALGLEHAVLELLRGERDSEFEFTESDSAIKFQRDDQDVAISASYAPQRAVVKLNDLAVAIRSFKKKVVDEVFEMYPQLHESVAATKLLEG